MVDGLIADYLGRLDAAARPLTPTRRAELASEVREHIESALAEAGQRDETTVRNVLDRLGPPEEIVGAEMDDGGTAMPGSRTGASPTAGWAAQAAPGWGALEVIALVLLIAGAFFLWWLGPIIGIVLVWFSDRWTRHEKKVATTIVLGLLIVQVLVVALFVAAVFPASLVTGGGDQPMPISSPVEQRIFP